MNTAPQSVDAERFQCKTISCKHVWINLRYSVPNVLTMCYWDVTLGVLVVGRRWQIVLDVRHFDIFTILIVTAEFKHQGSHVRRDPLLWHFFHYVTHTNTANTQEYCTKLRKHLSIKNKKLCECRQNSTSVTVGNLAVSINSDDSTQLHYKCTMQLFLNNFMIKTTAVWKQQPNECLFLSCQ